MKIRLTSDKDVTDITLGITGFLARIKGILGLYIFNEDAMITDTNTTVGCTYRHIINNTKCRSSA